MEEVAQWRGPSLREVRGSSYSRRLESVYAIRSPPARRLPSWKTGNARPSLGPRKRANWPRGRNLTFSDQKKRGRPRKRSRTLAGRLPRRRWMVVLMLMRGRCLRVPRIRTPRGASSKPRAPWAYDRHIYQVISLSDPQKRRLRSADFCNAFLQAAALRPEVSPPAHPEWNPGGASRV